ncbi:MAG: hypothetical protein RI568_06825 [Natronomonas sp.]|jgi:hypothetical protein|uniref:hypothetical protein n=1 Tax=Natronomonas sp. TaxID=2184060 RepID=UPI00287018EB|nr:hypothetical protein [Natronomonas sp.]MDR9430399.1 hypothetical protein [Natronomonas sp.]
MGIDIGQALREGASRTAAKNGLVLAVAFAGIALLTTVLLQSLTVTLFDSMLSFLQGMSPQEMGIDPAEYEQMISEFEMALENVRSTSPFALGLSAGAAFAGILVLALVAEAASIVAVRVFATESAESASRALVTENILLATLNGFVGGIVVWGLIIVGSLFFLLPGIVLAVLFYFLRQEIALKDKNFVQAMADSWRLTKGNRIEVFIIGVVLVIVSRLEEVSSAAVGTVSTPAGTIVAAIVGGLLTAFGAAVVTRAYVQIDDSAEPSEPEPEDEPDPYDAALGPDDLPR